MTKEKVDLLQGICFHWKVQDINWDNMHKQLVDFKQKYSKICVSKSMKAAYKKMLQWLNEQKVTLNSTTNLSMKEKGRRCKLQSLGMEFKKSDDVNPLISDEVRVSSPIA